MAADRANLSASLAYELIGGDHRRPIGSFGRLRQRIERLPRLLGGVIVFVVVFGLFAGTLGGVLVALTGAGLSLLLVALGVSLMLACVAVASHLVPPRISDLLE